MASDHVVDGSPTALCSQAVPVPEHWGARREFLCRKGVLQGYVPLTQATSETGRTSLMARV